MLSWKREILIDLRRKRPSAKIRYILPGKTGTTSVSHLLTTLKKTNPLVGEVSHDHYRQANVRCINIMTIREPSKRFESTLHYKAWKYRTLRNIPKKNSEKLLATGHDLDEVLVAMMKEDKGAIGYLHGTPDYTITAATGVDICLTIDEIPEAVQILLNLPEPPEMPHLLRMERKNKSLSKANLELVRNTEPHKSDYIFWRHWTRSG